MGYDLLSQVNESAQHQDEYKAILNTAIDVLEFEHDVIRTDEQFAKFLDNIADRPLLEYGGAAAERAGEREWMGDISAASKRNQSMKRHGGQEIAQRGIGLNKPQQSQVPKRGQVVLLPDGLGQIVEFDQQGKQVMVRSKAGKEFVVKINELTPGKVVNKRQTWGLKNTPLSF